ncbi:hypothetical protein [Phnomibacter sp. MR]|uniref:hypothetical protein n=1 Tax=Phnomibacter sp. MR TaxID=3042318 RepID=UPI003A7FF5A9
MYSEWDISNKDWIHKTDDLPSPIDLINVIDPDGKEWLVLEIQTSWTEPADIGEDKWENPHKDLWYQIRAYLTKVNDYKTIIEWAKGKNFMDSRMPEPSRRYEMFSREFYWSPASKTFRREYYNGTVWNEIFDQKTRKYVGEVASTSLDYSWGEEFDASKKSNISFFIPSEILFNLLDVQYTRKEGLFMNSNKEIICFDPCTENPTYSCLLVSKTELLEKLEANDLNIFWTLLGEKMIIGERHNKTDYVGRLDISGVIYFDKKILTFVPHFTK